ILMWLSALQESQSIDDARTLSKFIGLNRRPTIQDIRQYVVDLKELGYCEIEERLNCIRLHFADRPAPSHYNKYLDWCQVAEMKGSGITFGSHAVSHRILDRLDDSECLSELVVSREALEHELCEPVHSFAYPNGDNNARVRDLVKSCGYSVAFATDQGFYSSGCDQFRIPRINVHENSTFSEAMFMCTILNIF
ncbi:MAG: hypothetical protein DRR42_22055, partial [Gammaproteobacteria bacterium]